MEEALTDLKVRGGSLSTALAIKQAEQKVLLKHADSIVRGFEEEVESLSDQKESFLEDVCKTLKDESTERCGGGKKSFSAALALKREDFVLQLKKKLDSVKFEMENYAIYELETQLKEREEYFSSINSSINASLECLRTGTRNLILQLLPLALSTKFESFLLGIVIANVVEFPNKNFPPCH
jgi:5-methylcytosine-specific restriction endonuclease McrBC GTP-binding regulatory subunit McrB